MKNTASAENGMIEARKSSLVVMPRPNGFYRAGSGWSRYYRNQENARRAFDRLYAKGYECGVIHDRPLGYGVLVSRYAR